MRGKEQAARRFGTAAYWYWFPRTAAQQGIICHEIAPNLISLRKAEDGQHILQSTYTTRATLKVQAMITNKKDPFVTGGPAGGACPHQA